MQRKVIVSKYYESNAASKILLKATNLNFYESPTKHSRVTFSASVSCRWVKRFCAQEKHCLVKSLDYLGLFSNLNTKKEKHKETTYGLFCILIDLFLRKHRIR